jgi:hypothetical protein
MYHIQIKVNQNPTMHHPHNVGYDKVVDEPQLHCSFHLVPLSYECSAMLLWIKLFWIFFLELHGNFLITVGLKFELAIIKQSHHTIVDLISFHVFQASSSCKNAMSRSGEPTHA